MNSILSNLKHFHEIRENRESNHGVLNIWLRSKTVDLCFMNSVLSKAFSRNKRGPRIEPRGTHIWLRSKTVDLCFMNSILSNLKHFHEISEGPKLHIWFRSEKRKLLPIWIDTFCACNHLCPKYWCFHLKSFSPFFYADSDENPKVSFSNVCGTLAHIMLLTTTFGSTSCVSFCTYISDVNPRENYVSTQKFQIRI